MRAVGPDKRSGKQILVTLGAYPLPIRKSSKVVRKSALNRVKLNRTRVPLFGLWPAVFLLEGIMTAFKGNGVVHEFTQTNPAAPEKVFPLTK
jgi:hypothetical protein